MYKVSGPTFVYLDNNKTIPLVYKNNMYFGIKSIRFL